MFSINIAWKIIYKEEINYTPIIIYINKLNME